MAHEDVSEAVYQRELADFASKLRKLKIECGNPSQRSISGAAPSGPSLSVSAISEALNGKRLPSVDFLIALVRTLLSFANDNQASVGRNDPRVEPWRAEWTRLANLRDEARHAPPAPESVRPPIVDGAPQPSAQVRETPAPPTNTSAPMENRQSLRFRHAPPVLPHSGFVWSVAFSPDGDLMATGSAAGIVALWDPATRQAVGKPLPGHTTTVRSVAFSPDGGLLAAASDIGTVRLWDPATHEAVGALPTAKQEAVTAVTFSPDGALLATASYDRTVRLWDRYTYEAVGKPLTGHTGPVTAVAFSPEGALLATASFDGMVRLWDPTTHQAVGKPLIGHDGPVRSVAFSPSGGLLATASDDGMVRLWDPATHQTVGAPLTGHTGSATAVAFSPGTRPPTRPSERH
ncbi:WD40 repeat domain-containing protein [Streptomyces viridochromogenes]|uniref:WD40 repeat domain-containing protein n=1 Tax=Streptomyces viridochromogenes TaxID=1938 RepID=UPI00065C8B0A|nr:WD40 repeat domain-containing protein [Streptomyces viridochromogenes]